MKYFSLLFLCLAMGFCHSLQAQHENDLWIFGGDPFPTDPPALDFFSGEPVAVPTNPTSCLWSTEAAAAVADTATGKLLFYTDANQAYNADHTLMTNGCAPTFNKLSRC